jgi:hypothetical protein
MATPPKKDALYKYVHIAEESRDAGELLRVVAHTARALSVQDLAAKLDKISRPVTQESVPLERPNGLRPGSLRQGIRLPPRRRKIFLVDLKKAA